MSGRNAARGRIISSRFRRGESVDRSCENDSGILASRITPLERTSSGNASIIQERQGVKGIDVCDLMLSVRSLGAITAGRRAYASSTTRPNNR